MSTTMTVVELAERVRRIDWAGNFEHTRSRLSLMYEYLRRAAWWAEALDKRDEWPFFDVAAATDASVRADRDLVGWATQGLAWYPKRVCTWALHLAQLRAVAPARAPDLDDPYEPLIVMFERGGGFTTANGLIEVDLAQFPASSWSDHRRAEPYVLLDPAAALDDLDRPT